MDELPQQRLWKTLDTIGDRLTGIEDKLSEVVRLEEKVNNHNQILTKYNSKLDDHDKRLRDSELWQADRGDKASFEKAINRVSEEVDELRTDFDEVKSTVDVNRGHKDIAYLVLKGIAIIVGGVLVYQINKGL